MNLAGAGRYKKKRVENMGAFAPGAMDAQMVVILIFPCSSNEKTRRFCCRV